MHKDRKVLKSAKIALKKAYINALLAQLNKIPMFRYAYFALSLITMNMIGKRSYKKKRKGIMIINKNNKKIKQIKCLKLNLNIKESLLSKKKCHLSMCIRQIL